MLQAELEEVKMKYWQCFNNWECDENLEKIYCQIEELNYRLAIEASSEMEDLRKVG